MPISVIDMQCFARSVWERLTFLACPMISSSWQDQSQCPAELNARQRFSLSLCSIIEKPLALFEGNSRNEALK